jgi:hypothetical protein
MIRPDLGKTEDYLPVGGQNISHFGREKVRGINALLKIRVSVVQFHPWPPLNQ